jgi:quinol-cytochrome oxidoreductase complex cytochrome b subunit
VLLPLAVGAVVVLHVLLVRMKGVVPPLDAAESDSQLHHPEHEKSPAHLAAAETEPEIAS